jgi:hypothetical protein
MSTAKDQQPIRKQSRRLDALLRQLLRVPAGVRGTLSRIYTRCGKPTCWCARQPQGHPHTRLTWSQNGTLRTCKVPADRLAEVIRLTRNHRRFRTLRRQLRAAQTDLAGLLDVYEQAITDDTRSALAFPPPPAQTVTTTPKRRRKEAPSRKQNP